MPSPAAQVSDLCKRFRCWIVCCGGTVVVQDAKEKDPVEQEEKETQHE